jgi:hypothetical protein
LANRQAISIEARRLGKFAFLGQCGWLYKLTSKETVLLIDSLALGPRHLIEAQPGDETAKGSRVNVGLLGLLHDGRYVCLVGFRESGQPVGKATKLVAVEAA